MLKCATDTNGAPEYINQAKGVAAPDINKDKTKRFSNNKNLITTLNSTNSLTPNNHNKNDMTNIKRNMSNTSSLANSKKTSSGI